MNVFDINLFQMKTRPGKQEKASDFITKGYVKIGWDRVPDMKNMTKEDIRSELASKYGHEGRSLSTNLGTLNTFAKVMKSGDIVLINHDEFVHIGVVGDYFSKETEKGKWDHRRPCDWRAMVKKDELKEEVKSLLRNMTTVTKFPYPFITSGIPEILGITTEKQRDIIALTVSNDENSKEIKNEKKVEKDSLGRLELLREVALKILEEEMKSEDPDRRRKAAVDLLSISNKTSSNDHITD
ncbi:hypothetical protein ABEY55_26115 [Priestia aryabhattai]|uniref:hypothetical protein n=1 Tax=Priestia aryabhattai TaxID=412384 RepID=UPI003D27DEF6